MFPIAPKRQSALDLNVKGSMGDFSVSRGDAASLRVHYLLSHIGLELEGDHQERLLSKLAPFREVFDVRSLDFDQIMQRDIDDARVSTELIPYLLEQADSGLVKLFPPIIVVVLPVDSGGRPAANYPEVVVEREHEGGMEYEIIRSGPVGQEVFALRSWHRDGEAQAHDFAELRINTNRSKLVIVDGQHRAMSLLALYRNIKGWPERSRSVEPYYRMWTKAQIERFDLRRARLPIMFCVFPQIDGRHDTRRVGVYHACRSIFLALNKNARAVSRSRNILLDDRDVVSTFLRQTLGFIKERTFDSPEAIRLWAVELDNEKDRAVLTAPVAMTNVTHLNGMLERVLLADIPAVGLRVRQQNPWKRQRLTDCIQRLLPGTELPSGVEKRARRADCDPDVVERLVAGFKERYLPIIVHGLDSFAPYRVHHEAANASQHALQTGPTAEFYRAILFEGEGMHRVFESYLDHIDDRVREDEPLSPEFKQVREEFRKRKANLHTEIDAFKTERTSRLLEHVPLPLRENKEVTRWVDEKLYGDILTTAAFQNALFLTFFAMIEKVNGDRRAAVPAMPPFSSEEVIAHFKEYIEGLNRFFLPRRTEGLRNLLRVLYGDLADDGAPLKSNHCLRSILISGELKPDEWPKFRAILQELWRTEHPELASSLKEVKGITRRQALHLYLKREIKAYCDDHGLRDSDLSATKRAEIEQSCVRAFVHGCSALGIRINGDELLRSALTYAESEIDT